MRYCQYQNESPIKPVKTLDLNKTIQGVNKKSQYNLLELAICKGPLRNAQQLLIIYLF